VRTQTTKKILGFIVFLTAVAAWQIVHIRFGVTEGFRVWGIGLLLVASMYLFVKEIPIHVGSRPFSPLTGRRKAFALIPAILIGLAISLYPHEVACSVHMRGHICP
jgi:hypothetical protein